MALILGLATPKAVLVISASEVDALAANTTVGAYLLCGGLATFTGLRSLSGAGKEKVRQPLTGAIAHPIVISLDAVQMFDGRHVHTPMR